MRDKAHSTGVRIRKFSLVSLGLLSAGLAGCAAGPDWKTPAPPADTAYQASAAAETAGNAAQAIRPGAKIAADWYYLLGSTELDALVNRALIASPTLAAARARFQAARHDLEAVSGSRFPAIDVGAGASRNRGNGARVGIDNPLFSNEFNLYTANVSVSYALDLSGGEGRAVEESAAEARLAHNRMIGAQVSLVDNVVLAALQLAALQDEIAASRRIVALEQRTLDLTQAREQAGSVSLSDVLRARSSLASAQARLPELEKSVTAVSTRLAALVGDTPHAFKAPDLSLGDFTLPRNLPLSLPSTLVRQRPDILAAQAQLHAASAAVGVATANLYPHITLTADYGTQSNSISDLFKPPATVWGIGASLLYPLFHGHALRARQAAAKSRFNAAYADYRQTVLTAFSQVASVLGALEQDADVLQAREQALADAAASRRLVLAQYRAGAAGYTDVLSSEQAYQLALIDHIQAVSARFQDTAALYQALGGGWWNAGSVPHSMTAAQAAMNQERN